ncbi:MAG: aspartate kinase [Nitrospirae bacterium GWC2_56_14]|nr:MAG: aspartate kinase [Nitrospirae bacterium GWC2_56_14]
MLIVQKYGGTSVGNPERIKNVARRVCRTKEEGHDVVVVLSAMSGETDKLINLAAQVSDNPDPREMDMLISTGERVTIALLAMAIQSLGHTAQSFTGRQAGIISDCVHTKARIEKITGERLKQALKEGKIAVVAGFQGITEGSDDVTTLGRGGSDLSAVAVAAALKADVCDIYTDVDGVYTTDPNMVPQARKLDKISYDEMLELASLGAKVLQTRSVEFAKKYNVPVRVLSSFNDNPGTLVTKEDADMEKVVVSGVAYDKNQVKVTIQGVPDKPGVAAKIFNTISDNSVVVDMIIQNIGEGGLTDMSFTVPKTDAKKINEVMKKVVAEIGAKNVSIKEDVSKISIVGVGMRSHSGVAAKMFSAMAKEGINIMMISTSEIKISCVIDAKYTELAVRVLHETFEMDKAA